MSKSNYVLWLLLAISFTCMQGLTSVNIQPNESEDAVGIYSVINHEQCRRLCWYRSNCRSYSHKATATNGTDNCVLHADALGDGQSNCSSSDEWKSCTASVGNINNGCHVRPCKESEVCVPVDWKSTQYNCLPLHCPKWIDVPNAHVLLNGTNRNDTAVVKCQPRHVAVPKGVSLEIRCQATYKWTVFNGSCTEVEFYSTGTVWPIPWQMTDGVKMCIKGKFIQGQMDLNFLADRNWTNIALHIPFRYMTNWTLTNCSFWTTKVNGNFTGPQNTTFMPLVPGEMFNLTVSVLSTLLKVTFDNKANYTLQVPLGPVSLTSADVSKVKYVNVGAGNGSNKIEYVNTASGC